MKFPDPERALRTFLSRLPPDIRVERAILYGSRARGEHTPDSDADLAIILHEGGNDSQLMWMLGGLAYDVFIDSGIMIQPVPIAVEDWLHPETFLRPSFLRNIAREGIVM
jgi:predicted nucleotidyltransferase